MAEIKEIYKFYKDTTYEISNLGNLRNGENLLSNNILTKPPNSYIRNAIMIGNKRCHKLRHILVAETFIGDKPENLDTDHIDRNSLNNRVENLRYVTRKENMKNTNSYRADILTTDEILRRRIIGNESDKRNGRVKLVKKIGHIKALDSGKFRARINKITDGKRKEFTATFKTEEEAKNFLKEKQELN